MQKLHNVESTAQREVQTKSIQLKKKKKPKETVKMIKGVANMSKVFVHLC